jgi:hypothetical protein
MVGGGRAIGGFIVESCGYVRTYVSRTSAHLDTRISGLAPSEHAVNDARNAHILVLQTGEELCHGDRIARHENVEDKQGPGQHFIVFAGGQACLDEM